jgi:predicted TIM-barrel fold metal-dependent hydrolase
MAGRSDVSLVLSLAEACPNVLLATTGLAQTYLSAAIATLGARRVLLASGYPIWPLDEALRTVERACPDRADRELILGENAAHLLAGEWSM